MTRNRTRTCRKLSFEPLDSRCMLAGNVFHYAADPFDINMDGQHNIADLRVVVLDLMEHGARTLEANDELAGHYMVDVSGDGVLNSQDIRQLFAVLTTVADNPNDHLQDVVADEPLVTSVIHLAEGGGGGGGGFGGGGLDGGGLGGGGGAALADFQALIDLIQSTVPPEAWNVADTELRLNEQQGNLSLIVRQTQDVQDQISDLLQQLRALQDLQITVEVRFVTLADNFFDQIGIDFDFDIDDNSQTGQTPTDGNDPIVDIDLSFLQESFGGAIPQFGGFDPVEAANVGFAILSDIEAFFLIQAAQGDQRANVLQAPAVTLFNGQLANVIDQIQRPFVTSVIPVVGNSSVGFQPVINVLNEGTLLNVEADISADQRFIRLELAPQFGQISEVDTFTFEVTTTVQLPTFSFTTISTTVSVPDGGTVLLGGIQRLTEARNQLGVPRLNDLPYISRLFRNVSVNVDTQSIMLMVTPRIIIQEEEE